MDLPSMTITITWLLGEVFTIIILVMDSAPYAECLDVVPCGVFVGINNCLMDGLATTRSLINLLRNHKYKLTRQTKRTWNGFHMIVLGLPYAHIVYLLLKE